MADKLTFELSEEETKLARKFMSDHFEKCPNKGKYQGAIGVSYTFSFTDTSIGQMASVECHCKAREFLSQDL